MNIPSSSLAISTCIDRVLRDIEPPVEVGAGSVAIVCLLYGPNPSNKLVANAIALGQSLVTSAISTVLLVTPDVPGPIRALLRECFSEVREIEYILANIALFKKDWFREVFTKFHIFNLCEYQRVLFLDLDIIVTNASALEYLVLNGPRFAAMENSKSSSAASMTLNHLDPMGDRCRLINAGVMLMTPNRDLFNLLVEDVCSDSPHHVPGMTPEQFYLARVMGHHFHHIAQLYNFEIQFHGGVPITPTWTSASIEDIVCIHFSGGDPLSRISKNDSEWGCQTEKRMVLDRWYREFSVSEREGFNKRGLEGFRIWTKNFTSGCMRISKTMSPESICQLDDTIKSMLRLGSSLFRDCSVEANAITLPLLVKPVRPARVAPSLA